MGKGCVACGCLEYKVLLDLDCGGFDNSPLYEIVIVASCNECGHIYNLLTEKQIYGLYDYYRNEYSQANIESPNKAGDIPGSSSIDSLIRYNNLYHVIEKDIKRSSNVLDVGCAMGGFLNFISGYCDNLFGIDSTQRFVDIARQKFKDDNIKLASAELIPYQDKFFDIIFADQVVEHLIDPNIFFKEANRVLKENGVLCVSVPNALYYKDVNFFDFYFFLMREHVHHFDFQHLISIASKAGFVVESQTTAFTNLISSIGKLPNLTIKFRKSKDFKPELIESKLLNLSVKEYIEDSYKELVQYKKLFKEIFEKGEEINIYGIGREFHYLWRNTLLRECKVNLYDDTPIKQKMKVARNSILPLSALNLNAKLTIIAPFAHKSFMCKKLRDLGFRGDII